MSHFEGRRQFLQTSLLAGGAGLSLPAIAEARQKADAAGLSDTAVIQIWLGGGPSQFETFDPKPEAPIEFRGPYESIQTCHPGILACEKMPRTAQVLDQVALIRSVAHTTNGHFVGAHWCSTGYIGTNNASSHPSSGSLASMFKGPNRPGLPAYVLLSEEQTRNPESGRSPDRPTWEPSTRRSQFCKALSTGTTSHPRLLLRPGISNSPTM